MYKWFVCLITFASFMNVAAQTIPTDFNPQTTTKQNTINKDISKKERKTFNNLNHPLSITGGVLTFVGAGLYVVGSETLNKKPITDRFLDNYSPQTNLQYIGIGVFATGAVLFTIFSTDRSVKAPKRKKNEKYEVSDWEIVEE